MLDGMDLGYPAALRPWNPVAGDIVELSTIQQLPKISKEDRIVGVM
jgi:hypothetical protein